MNTLVVFKSLFALLSLIIGPFLPEEVLFESIESKTDKGQPVFNKVSLKTSSKKDVWVMKQSHHGLDTKNWDHIKIVVDKSKKPFTASYHQMDSKGNEIEYKTSCFRCHSGGPRYIRAKSYFSTADKLKIQKWNLLIKSYGDVKNIENKPFERRVKFIENEKSSKMVLKVKSCTSCHYKGGPRAPLTASQKLTIKHLVKTKAMPPWPYKMQKGDKARLNKFIYGF